MRRESEIGSILETCFTFYYDWHFVTFFVQKRDAFFKVVKGRVAELTKHKIANNLVEICYNENSLSQALEGQRLKKIRISTPMKNDIIQTLPHEISLEILRYLTNSTSNILNQKVAYVLKTFDLRKHFVRVDL